MAFQIQYWFHEILRHVPMVTTIGFVMALVLSIAWFARWREAGLLAMVCLAYGLTPFVPHW